MNRRQKKKLRKRGLCFHYREFEALYKEFYESDIVDMSTKSRYNFAALRCIMHDIKEFSKYHTYDFRDYVELNQNIKRYVIDIDIENESVGCSHFGFNPKEIIPIVTNNLSRKW